MPTPSEPDDRPARRRAGRPGLAGPGRGHRRPLCGGSPLSRPPGRAFVGVLLLRRRLLQLPVVRAAGGGRARSSSATRSSLATTGRRSSTWNGGWWDVLSRLPGTSAPSGLSARSAWPRSSAAGRLDRWLAAAACPPSHRLPALLLVHWGRTSAGPAPRSSAAARALPRPPRRACSRSSRALANPHFVAGTGAAALGAPGPRRARTWGGRLRPRSEPRSGSTRPYDLVSWSRSARSWSCCTEPPAPGWRLAAAMAGLLPVAAYDYWLFYRRAPRSPSSPRREYLFPGRADFAWALGPAGAARRGLRSAAGRRDGRAAPRAHAPRGLVRRSPSSWSRAPVPFSLQFLAGIGLPLLALAAIGLGRCPVGYTIAAALALSSTAVAAVWLTLQPTLAAYVPAERFALAWALRSDCRAGDRLVAPRTSGSGRAGSPPAVPSRPTPSSPPTTSDGRQCGCSTRRAIPRPRRVPGARLRRPTSCCRRPCPPTQWVDPRIRLEPVAVAGNTGRQLAAYRIASSCAVR